MSTGPEIDRVFEAAQVLTPLQQMRLADKLYQNAAQSLDPQSEAYLRMLDERDAAVERNETKTYSWEEVRKMVFPEDSP